VVADILHLPHRDAFFDFAVCIAVVHHMSTPARRIEAIAEILRTIKRGSDGQPGGRILVYAWALEQKNSRRGWDKGDSQDLMVPWVRRAKPGSGEEDQTFHRYYHLYESGELERDIEQAGGVVVESGYEKDNWWAIATPKHDS
jgi:tRNA (uracil-5-)-methyltransferase TRM9